MQIEIRRAEQEDAAALRDLYAMPGAQSGTLQLPFPSLVIWEQRLTPREGHTVLVAEADSLLVGNLSLQVEPNPRRRHVAHIGMAVRDDWAGRGVGSRLMAAATDLADNWLGLRKLELFVYTDNQPAIALYQNHGFEIEGTRRQMALRDGVYKDAYAMGRLTPKL